MKKDRWSIISVVALIAAASALIVAVFTVFRFGEGGVSEWPSRPIETLTDGWMLETEDGWSEVSIPGEFAGESGRVVLRREFSVQEGSDQVLLFQNHRQSIEMAVDGEVIYQSNMTGYVNTLGVSSYSMVKLPEKEEPYFLELRFYLPGKGEASVPEIRMGTQYMIVASLLERETFTLASICVLLVMGLLLLVVILFFRIRKRRERRLWCLTLFLFDVVLWVFMDSTLSTILHVREELSACISYYTFMVMPLPIIYFSWFTCKRKYNSFRILGILSFANIALQTVFSVSGILPLQRMLFLTHILIAAVIVVSIRSFSREMKESDEKELKYLYYGFWGLAFFAVTAVALYWSEGDFYYRSAMLVGTSAFYVVMLYSMIYSYMSQGQKQQMKLQELEVYETLSMRDNLTGLENRRAFEQYIRQVHEEAEPDENAILIMLDLNGLKYTNDTFGHNAGDELIAAAARCILEIYRDVGRCFRIGGDEFTVVIPNLKGGMSYFDEKLEEYLKEYSRHSDYPLSLAKGESSLIDSVGHKLPLSDWKQQADMNMYRDKSRQKSRGRQGASEEWHEAIGSVVETVEAKDSHTADHSLRVCALSEFIAECLGLSEITVAQVRVAAQMHDIGKVGVPDYILTKPDKLTEDEYGQIQRHSQIGSHIMSRAESMGDVSDIILHHHEHYDGSGYPDHIVGHEIPIGARIIAVADSIDAMTSERCYRGAMSLEECRKEIEKNLDILYDPVIGRIVLEHWDEVEELVMMTPKRLLEREKGTVE